MKLSLFRRPKQGNIAALYGTIVAQARSPAFYRIYGVPDTVAGRLEMILLHTFLLCRRADGKSDAMRAIGQRVFDRFCNDMDGNLREMGVGDLGVPRHMRRIGEAFYGRSAVYEQALAADDKWGLAEALMRNVFSGLSQHSDGARRLAAYAFAAGLLLASQEEACVIQGQIKFPDADGF